MEGESTRGGKASVRNSDDSFSLFLLPSQRNPTGVGQSAQRQIEAAIAVAHLPTLNAIMEHPDCGIGIGFGGQTTKGIVWPVKQQQQ